MENAHLGSWRIGERPHEAVGLRILGWDVFRHKPSCDELPSHLKGETNAVDDIEDNEGWERRRRCLHGVCDDLKGGA